MNAGKVLIVDDDEAIVSMLEEVCKLAKRECVCAYSVHEALALLEAEKSISLVITDMNLPDLSGRQIFTHIRRKQKSVRVVLSSGLLKEDFEDILEQPNTAFLQKPYLIQDVLTHMSAH